MKRRMKIIQETTNRWRIENAKGDTLVSDLMLESVYRAEQYIKAYVSSFINYDYEVITLNKAKKPEGI